MPEGSWAHVTYSPWVLLCISAALSLLIALLVAFVSRRWIAVALVVASPAPLLLLAREHLPVLSGLPPGGLDFCFGAPGPLHLVSFLLPLAAGFLTLVLQRGRNAHAHA